MQVPCDRDSVSGRHLSITVNDDGSIVAEDLNSTNGTYLKDSTGAFHRIYKKQVAESDILRLGATGAGSFTISVHRALNPDDTYAYEFRQLKKQLRIQRQLEHEKEKKIEINGWISKCSGIIVIGLCALAGSISGVDIDPNVRYVLIACAPVAVGLIFGSTSKQLKALRKRREKTLVCPRCNRPLSEFDLEQGQCSRCKAK